MGILERVGLEKNEEGWRMNGLSKKLWNKLLESKAFSKKDKSSWFRRSSESGKGRKGKYVFEGQGRS